MSRSATFESTLEQLRGALSDPHVSNDLLNAGQKLLRHLEKPTQITVLGKPGAGKTSLLNMMLGDNCIPDLPDVQIIELMHGAQERAICRGDATVEFDGRASRDTVPAGTTHVVQVTPSPALSDKTAVEVNLPLGDQGRKEVLDWVVQNTSLTLWCTQDFDPDEAALWSTFPDALKDYAFLVLTKADRLQMRGTLRQHTSRFQEAFSDEFLCMYPVATKRALAARQTGTVIDDKLWATSGGKALVEGLQRQVESARLADLDHANFLLQKLKRASKSLSAPAGASPNRPAAAGGGATSPAEKPDPKPRPPQPKAPRDKILNSALELLQQSANEMLNAHGPSAAVDVTDILDRTTQTAQALSALLVDSAAEDPILNALHEDVLESQQVILLLQLEGTETAARDSVTALLQLKKEMSEVAVAC